ncbi:MAG TPA: hypothetical protein VGK89_13235 [Candidatus Eisenbacteria bacterium]
MTTELPTAPAPRATPRTDRRDVSERRRIEVRLTAEVACAG